MARLEGFEGIIKKDQVIDSENKAQVTQLIEEIKEEEQVEEEVKKEKPKKKKASPKKIEEK